MDAVWRDIIITQCLSLRLPLSLSSISGSFLFTPGSASPLTDPFPNCPNYRTACTFIPKHADKSLTELRTDLLQNVQIQPIPHAHPLHPTHCRQLLTSTHWSLLVDHTLNTRTQKTVVQSVAGPLTSSLCLNNWSVSLCSSRADAYACRNVSCEKFNTHEAELLRCCRDVNVILKQSFVKSIYLGLVTVMAEGGLCLFSISQPVSFPFLQTQNLW